MGVCLRMLVTFMFWFLEIAECWWCVSWKSTLKVTTTNLHFSSIPDYDVYEFVDGNSKGIPLMWEAGYITALSSHIVLGILHPLIITSCRIAHMRWTHMVKCLEEPRNAFWVHSIVCLKCSYFSGLPYLLCNIWGCKSPWNKGMCSMGLLPDT